MSETLSPEGIALLEHLAAERGKPFERVDQPADKARAAAAYRLFTGAVRHSELSAEDAAPLLKLPTASARDALDELVQVGSLVLNGSMYQLPRAAARELGPTQAQLSAHAKELGARGGAKGGAARAAALSPECRQEISHAAARERWQRDQQAKQAPPPEPVTGVVSVAASEPPPAFDDDLRTCRHCGVLFDPQRPDQHSCNRHKKSPPPQPRARKPFTVRTAGVEIDCETLEDVIVLVQRLREAKAE